MREKIKGMWESGFLKTVLWVVVILCLSTYCGRQSSENHERALQEEYGYGYDDGYNEGYSKGWEEAEDEWFTEGEKAGYDDGYYNGYNDGLSVGKELILAGIDDGIEEYRIRWEWVDSEAFGLVGYDAGNQVLVLDFHRSGTYFYYGVPEDVYEELIQSDRPGSYYNEVIRDVYTYDNWKDAG